MAVLEQHEMEMVPEVQCDTGIFNRCNLRERGFHYLQSVSHPNAYEQIRKLNGDTSRKEEGLDMDN